MHAICDVIFYHIMRDVFRVDENFHVYVYEWTVWACGDTC
jgi:hypothetical protein